MDDYKAIKKQIGVVPKDLRKIVDEGKKQLKEGIIIVCATKDEKIGFPSNRFCADFGPFSKRFRPFSGRFA